MKQIKSLILPLFLLASLTGCSNGSSLNYKKGDKIYYDRIIFDTSSEEVINPSIHLESAESVKSVKIGREDLKFGFKNKILTLDGEALKKAGAGEKQATVTFKSGKKTTVDIFSATKLIKTAQEFQDIGKDAKSAEGLYVLANDIDCSSIDNFEPIGQYFEETDPTNFYFHGILDGDGFAIKNVKCSYSDSPIGTSGGGYQSNYDVYSGSAKFTNDAHKSGDNIGIFQIIGSSGVVRNVTFDNCKVHGRTIVGVVAANVMGTVENVLVRENCSVKMDTHFYDDDCNTGAAFGIVAGSGNVSQVISLTSAVSMIGIYEDYNDEYKGKTGNGWDHSNNPDNTDPWWRFVSVIKEVPGTSTKIVDTNGKPSNGIYSVVGKCWGMVKDSVGASFKVTPYDESSYDVAFGHTHDGSIKPSSGDSNLGTLENCAVFAPADLKKVSTFDAYNLDTTYVWNLQEGNFPALRQNINRFDIAQ